MISKSSIWSKFMPISDFLKETINDCMTNKAESLNGRIAMVGMLALMVTYLATGDIIPGVF
tara:strand:+ start:457 stop:639 length:183 start_codon:yes stop_codon:yes gene_type:complete